MDVLAPLWLEALAVVLLCGRVAGERWLRRRTGRDLVARDRRPAEYVALLAAGAVAVALVRGGAAGAAGVWLVVVVVADAAWEYLRADEETPRPAG
jgi:hypothetical protein